MAGNGAGPSRRSHTKSRKGCKTCKRRHIRCDETFPQCRNCTKHQVQCDYMETVGVEGDGDRSPEQPTVVLTPNSESGVDLWQQTGSFPYPDLHVFPPPPTHEYTKNELRLIHHLSTVSNDLLSRGTPGLTLWTEKIPKFLSIASTYPYVMHALLAFSANHLAWETSSKEIRNLYLQHGSIALGGLHEAIGNFSRANADAVLAASLLLLWQTTDWRSWSSLRAGIQSVLSTMQSWRYESIFTQYIAEDDLFASSLRTHRRRSSVDHVESGAIFQHTIYSVQRLQMSLVGHECELGWVNQLIAYLQQLQSVNLPQTSEEQFNNLYQLRKWLFWIPVALLRRRRGQGPALLTVAHYYAVALAIEPLFPDLGQAFVSGMALGSLETILRVTDAMQSEHGLNASSMEIASLMQFPQQAAINYRSRATLTSGIAFSQEPSAFSVDPDALTYTTIGNLSPAFAPSPLNYGGSEQTASSSTSSYLEVPTGQPAFTYGTPSWGAAASPGFPPPAFTAQEEQIYGYSDSPLDDFRGGFVAATPVWT